MSILSKMRAMKGANKPRIRVTFDLTTGVIGPNRATPTKKPVSNVAQLKEHVESVQQHREGERCPHCSGTGHYHHADGRVGKCFRCDGKGTLDEKDMAFLHHRVKHSLPLALKSLRAA